MGSCEVIISSQIESVEEWRRAGGSSEGQETRSQVSFGQVFRFSI